jgi:hypothetical protein
MSSSTAELLRQKKRYQEQQADQEAARLAGLPPPKAEGEIAVAKAEAARREAERQKVMDVAAAKKAELQAYKDAAVRLEAKKQAKSAERRKLEELAAKQDAAAAGCSAKPKASGTKSKRQQILAGRAQLNSMSAFKERAMT